MQENNFENAPKKQNLLPIIIAAALLLAAIILAIVLTGNKDEEETPSPVQTAAPSQTVAESAPNISLTISKATAAKVGDEVTLDISLSDLKDALPVAALDFTIKYDTENLTYVSSEFVNLPFDAEKSLTSINIEEGGKIHFTALDYTVNDSNTIVSDGVYARITFKVAASGTEFAEVFVDQSESLDFCDHDSAMFSADVVSGGIEIVK